VVGRPLPKEWKWVLKSGEGNQPTHWSRTYQSPTAGATTEIREATGVIERAPAKIDGGQANEG